MPCPSQFNPQKRHGTHCIGWVGTRASLDRCRKSCPHQNSVCRPSSLQWDAEILTTRQEKFNGTFSVLWLWGRLVEMYYRYVQYCVLSLPDLHSWSHVERNLTFISGTGHPCPIKCSSYIKGKTLTYRCRHGHLNMKRTPAISRYIGI